MAAFDGSELDDLRDGEEPERDETTEDGAENYAALYLDGDQVEEAVTRSGRGTPELYEVERVQLEFPDAANGIQTGAQERAPLGWVNSAAITLDRDEDAVHVAISVGDPRGAFVFTIRRLPADSSHEWAGRLLMHLPHPADGVLHEALTEDHPGTYRIGR